MHLILLLAILFAQPSWAQSRQPVTLAVSDPFGAVMSDWTVEEFRDQRGRDWKALFEKGHAELPPGSYKVFISSTKRSMDFVGSIEVRWRKETYSVALSFEAMGGGTLSTSVEGRLRTVAEKDLSCVLSGVYLNEQLTTKVKADGGFSFQHVPLGTYTLACGSAAGNIQFHRLVKIRTLTDVDLMDSASSDLTLEIAH